MAGVQSFVRFLQLPPAEGRKRRDMLELETRQQIPMPLDLVARDTFTFSLPNPASRIEPVPVLLVAAQLRDMEEHVSRFEQAGIEVQAIQCDAVALHNFLHFDRLAPMPEATPDTEEIGLGVLDVGSETTNVLFSFRSSLWFRSVRPAGDDLLSALVQRFKLTRNVADEVLRIRRKPSA